MESAIDLIGETRPDVVLLDIWLGDGTGFDVLDRLAPATTRVIFITAFDHHAVRAFKSVVQYYLLKPVVRAELQEVALERVGTLPSASPMRT
ncbi:MAG: response regulator [Flavobacteriales bacterium]|nr:response regulator [Flavobacteriales bacterium]